LEFGVLISDLRLASGRSNARDTRVEFEIIDEILQHSDSFIRIVKLVACESFMPGQTRMTVAGHCSTCLTGHQGELCFSIVELPTSTFWSPASYEAAILLYGLQSDHVIVRFKNLLFCPFLDILMTHSLLARRTTYLVGSRDTELCVNAFIDAGLADKAFVFSTMEFEQAR
jgi:hypothetical protein